MRTQEWECWIIWWLYFQVSEESPYIPQWMWSLRSHHRTQESFLHTPTLVTFCLFGASRSHRSKVIPQRGLNLCFSNVYGAMESFLHICVASLHDLRNELKAHS